MDLRELRDMLLRIDHPESVLQLADMYLQHLQIAGDNFRLPKEHVLVKPLLEYYADDLEGWVKFVKGVRDRLPQVGRKFHPEVNELYRKLDIRLTQQERRERLDRAVAVALRKKLIADEYMDKMQYSRRCTQEWRLRRERILTAASKVTKGGRTSMADREVLLTEFWATIDAEIDNGEVPKP